MSGVLGVGAAAFIGAAGYNEVASQAGLLHYTYETMGPRGDHWGSLVAGTVCGSTAMVFKGVGARPQVTYLATAMALVALGIAKCEGK